MARQHARTVALAGYLGAHARRESCTDGDLCMTVERFGAAASWPRASKVAQPERAQHGRQDFADAQQALDDLDFCRIVHGAPAEWEGD